MPDLTQITGGVVLPDGSVPYEGRIHFTPVGWDCPAAGKVQPPATRSFELGPSGGLVDVYLSPSTTSLREMPYRVSVTHFNAATRAMETTDLGLISVPEVAEGGSVSIRSLLSDPGVIPTAPDALAQVTAKALEVDADRAAAQAARTAAQAAEAAAEASAATASTAAANALAAEINVEAAFANANVYETVSAGRASVADGGQFIVAAAGATEFVRYRRDSSTTQTEVARYPASKRVKDAYTKEQATIASQAYNEQFAFLDLASIVATNRFDGVPLTAYTPTKVTGGLQIALTLGSRLCTFRTANKTGANKTRFRYRGEHVTGTINGCGIGFTDGTDYTALVYTPYNGRLSFANTKGGGGILSTALPVSASDWVVEMEVVVDASSLTATAFVSLNGGAPFAFSLTNIAVGDVELNMIGASTTIHSVQIEAIGDYGQAALDLAAAPEIQQIDRNMLNAAVGLLATMQRVEPTGWTYSIPNGYQFYQTAGAYFSSIDLRPPLNENDPDVLVLHVDIATGSDANAGTASAPLKSLNVAQRRVGTGNAIIKAKGGLYPYANCYRGAIGAPGSIVQLVSWDGEPVVSSMHDATLAWTLDSGTTWVATQSVGSFSTVFDASDLTADGDYGALNFAPDLATCRATPGTWFATGTSRYVNLFDGREPDSDLRCYVRLVGGAVDIYGIYQSAGGGQTLYAEDLHVEGGDLPFATRTAVNTDTINTFAKRCTAKYGAGNGVNQTSAGLQVWQDCVAAWNGDDGFNWKSSPFGGAGPLAIEINCIGRWNGRDAEGTNNGSTMHSGGSVIRVNGSYPNNQDRNVHDITDCFSWNMGCTAGPSQSGKANFAIGVGSFDASLMWLDGCTSVGGGNDIEAVAGATARTFNFTGTGTNIGAGTITGYTP